MVKVICVSGSVCSGKTTIAKKIAKLLKFQYIDVKKIIGSNKEVVCGYDRKRKTKDIDVSKLNKVLIKIIDKSKDKGVVIDSHLSHYLPKKYVGVCVICECSDLKKLKKRLEKRKYSRLKIKENLEMEILEVCLIEAIESRHNVIVADTSKKVDFLRLKRLILHKV